jgi:hypothetical protein
MKTIRTKIEEVDWGNDFVLKGLNIYGEEYSLEVREETNGDATLCFYKGVYENRYSNVEPDFAMLIRRGKISFQRVLHRPGHDHNDLQSLQSDIDKKIKWISRFPYEGEGRENFTIDFGSAKED